MNFSGYPPAPPAPFGSTPPGYPQQPGATPYGVAPAQPAATPYGAAPNYGAAPPSYGPPAGGYGGYGAPSPAAPPAYGYGPSPSYAPPAHFGYQQPPRQAYAEGPAGTGAPALRWVVLGSFLGVFVVSIFSAIATSLSDNGDDAAAMIGAGFSMLTLPLILTYFVTTLVWIYKSWEMLPVSCRTLTNGTMVSPGQAVGRLFIPFYNLYWYFASTSGLCNGYNRALANYGSPKRTSSGLGITAAVFQVIPYANIAIAPFLWIAFMFNIESAKRELAQLSGQTR